MANSAPPERMQSDLFVPSSGELVIRDNIADGYEIPTEGYRKSGHLRRPVTMGGYRFGKLSMSSFFTRHNPHPKRVNHFKGLLDVPICNVMDYDSPMKGLHGLDFPPNNHHNEIIAKLPHFAINVNTTLFPMDTLTGLHYFHPFKSLPFGKQPAQVVVPDKWRLELQDLAKAAGLPISIKDDKPAPETSRQKSVYSADTGRLMPPPSRARSRGFTAAHAQKLQFMNQVNAAPESQQMEDSVMKMLCQILETEDVEAVQNWLGAAGDTEKNMVKELIQAAVEGRQENHEIQFPVQEYASGVLRTPAAAEAPGTVIGDKVQNRLSTADDEERKQDASTTDQPSQADNTGAAHLQQAQYLSAARETSLSATKRRPRLPPIAEKTPNDMSANSTFRKGSLRPNIPFSSNEDKDQDSLREKMHVLTNRTDSPDQKFTRYVPKDDKDGLFQITNDVFKVSSDEGEAKQMTRSKGGRLRLTSRQSSRKATAQCGEEHVWQQTLSTVF